MFHFNNSSVVENAEKRHGLFTRGIGRNELRNKGLHKHKTGDVSGELEITLGWSWMSVCSRVPKST